MPHPLSCCPKCTAPLPGDFAAQRFCPYCAHDYGGHARLCLACRRAWFPVFSFCPRCSAETGSVDLPELACAALHWTPTAPDYVAHGVRGLDLAEVRGTAPDGSLRPLAELHDLSAIMRYPGR